MTSNILAIEDNRADAEIIKIYLEESGFKHKFFHTLSLSDGFNTIKDNHIDLVLLDLDINDSMGFKTLKRYMDQASSVPVVIMTGLNNEVMGIQAVKAGAQDYLVKGNFDSKHLVKTIRYSLQRFKTQAELKQTAEELTIDTQRYQAVQKMAKFANWEMDIVNNTMKWSEEMYRIFGFQPNSFPPTLTSYYDYVHIEDKSKVERFFDEVIKNGKLNRIEHRLVVDGSTIKYLVLQARVNYDEITNKILLIGSIQDISEHRNAAIVPKEEKLVPKGVQITPETFSHLSFNIRTPLSSMVNLLFLLENTKLSTDQKDYINGIKTSIDDLSAVLTDLMNFSVVVSQKMTINEEQFSLTEFLENVDKVFQIKAQQAKIEVKLKLGKKLPDLIIADSQKITQILYNLLESTLNVTKPKSRIEIGLSSVMGIKSDPALQFLISYSGRALPKNNASAPIQPEQLIQAVSLDKKSSEYEVLNTVIISKIVKSLNGDFRLSNKHGQQYIYRLQIPIKFPKELGIIEVKPPYDKLNVLLVEDHALNQIATKQILTSWSSNISVDIASNGLEGLDKFNNANYHLVLMDLQMPVMDGIEASIKLRSFSQVPIIALTANASNQEEEKCYSIGINAYISKPFKPKDLYSKIISHTQKV